MQTLIIAFGPFEILRVAIAVIDDALEDMASGGWINVAMAFTFLTNELKEVIDKVDHGQ